MASHFLIVGAQRSGTTFLHRALESHPEVCMAAPTRPEPKFFLREDATSLGYDGYLKLHFSHSQAERVFGEKSTSYIERFDAIPRIQDVLPEARLIFVLRNPVDRAYSNWKFSRQHGLENLSFLDALGKEEERGECWEGTASVCPYSYIGRGLYADQLEGWRKHFARDRIHLMVSERMFADSGAVGELQDWLGLSPMRCTPARPLNSSPSHGGVLAERDRALIMRSFEDSNQRLRREWGLDISAWDTP